MRTLSTRLLSLAAGLLFGTAALAQAPVCEPARVAEKYPALAGKTIRVGVDPQTPPYASRDPKDFNLITGSDMELAKAVFACLGVRYELKPGAWSGLLPAIIADQLDLMFYLYYNATRVKQVDFVTYMKAGTGALTQAGNPKAIKSGDDLCGKTVAVGLGTVEEAQMRQLDGTCKGAGKAGVEVMTYPDHAAGFRLVQTARADVMLSDLALIDSQVSQNPSVYARAYGVVSGFQIGVATRKGNEPLHKAMLDGLRGVQAAGTQSAIFKKYAIDPSLELAATSRVD